MPFAHNMKFLIAGEEGRSKPKSVRFVSETEHTPEAHHRMPDLAHQLPGLDPDSVYVVSGKAVLV